MQTETANKLVQRITNHHLSGAPMNSNVHRAPALETIMDNNNNEPQKADTEVQEQVIDKLLSGYVEQIKLGSKTWISVAILSIFAISLSSIANDGNLKLPFLELSLTKEWSILIAIGLIAALVTRWVEAQCRALKTRSDIIQPILIELEKAQNKGKSATELWDARVFPGTATVWSAPASFVHSKYKIVRSLCLPYLIFLKIMSTIVHSGLPFAAVVLLVANWYTMDHNISKTIAMWLFAVVGWLQLLVGLVVDFRYSGKTIKRMKKLTNSWSEAPSS